MASPQPSLAQSVLSCPPNLPSSTLSIPVPLHPSPLPYTLPPPPPAPPALPSTPPRQELYQPNWEPYWSLLGAVPRSYAGHGAGARLLEGPAIARLDCRAVALLFGCSSAALVARGALEPSGIVLKYLMAGW